MKPLPGDSSGCWRVGTCLRRVAPRSYLVDVDGSTYRRNRVDLRVAEPSAHRFGEVDEPEVTHVPEHCTVDAPSLSDTRNAVAGLPKPLSLDGCTYTRAGRLSKPPERLDL